MTEYLHRFTELSRYTPDEVKTDEKKCETFLRGLDTGLKVHVEASYHPNFNHMVNKAITTERNRKEDMNERKRKFEGRKQQQQHEQSEKT